MYNKNMKKIQLKMPYMMTLQTKALMDRMGGWMGGWMDGWMDGCMDGWRDGDGRING